MPVEERAECIIGVMWNGWREALAAIEAKMEIKKRG